MATGESRDTVLVTDQVPADFPFPIVLGIDPGTAAVGYGALVLRPPRPRLLACGVLRAARSEPIASRLGSLRVELDALLARLRPTVVVLERAFSAKNVQSALRIGEGRGMVLAAAGSLGLRVVEYPPALAKKTIVGHGGAGKLQVARMVAADLGLTDLPTALDATDALALALTFVYKQSAAAGRIG
jgi:crossover junction endodeoxyribonuclease RuvC